MRPPVDPAEAANLLQWAFKHGFTTHIVGQLRQPAALVLVRFGASYIDIAHLRGADRTEAARLPRDEHANIWQPTHVTFHYYGRVLDALGALKRLPCPPDVATPQRRYIPPRDSTPRPLTITDAERATTTIRPPARRTPEGGLPLTDRALR
ncbi:MAG: hypothetical protein ACRDQ7_27720 [Haloechinothrix sp.]